MDGVTEDILIAEGRCEDLNYETAYVFSRSKLYDALPSSDNGRLKNLTNDTRFLVEQSGATRTNNEAIIKETEDHIKNEMNPREALFGGPNRKHQCPCMYVGFVNTLKCDYGSRKMGLPKDNTPLFDMYNGTNINLHHIRSSKSGHIGPHKTQTCCYETKRTRTPLPRTNSAILVISIY